MSVARAVVLALSVLLGASASGAQPGRTASRTPTIAFADSVHALVVFVRFSDDTAGAPEWPIDGRRGAERIPDWGHALVEADPADVTAALGMDHPSLSAYIFSRFTYTIFKL